MDIQPTPINEEILNPFVVDDGATSVDNKVEAVVSAAEKNGYRGIFLPNWAYDLLVMLNVLCLPFGTLYLTIAKAVGLPHGEEVAVISGALYIFLLVLTKFFKTNYDKVHS